MKKLLLLATIFVAIESSAQKFNIGIKAGANLSNFSGSNNVNDVKTKGLFGFHGGLWSRIKFGAFALQPEAMVSTQGAKYEDAGQTGEWKLTYVTVPVLLQVYPAAGFYLEAGPQVGFAVSKDMGSQTLNEFKDNLDFSVAAGLGYRVGRGFGIGVRYTAGLSKVGELPGSTSYNPDYKNGVIQASLYIPLK